MTTMEHRAKERDASWMHRMLNAAHCDCKNTLKPISILDNIAQNVNSKTFK